MPQTQANIFTGIHVCLLDHAYEGKGKESDPTDVSANMSAGGNTTVTLLTRRSTHYRHVGRHTMDASANTLPTRQLTLC